MKCLYCQKLCRKMESFWWQCDYHGGTPVKFQAVTTEIDPEKDFYTITLVCFLNNNTYHVSFFHNNPHVKEKFRIDKVIYKWQRASAQPVCQMDFHPKDITPENIQTKLPVYLTFL